MRVAFKTFGCRLNRAETAQYEDEFAAAGCEIVPLGAEPDIVVFHTCVVTAAAENECLRLIRSQRKKKANSLFVVSGCAVHAIPEERLLSLGVDLVIARANKDMLTPTILRKVGLAQGDVSAPAPTRKMSRALLKVQDGCDFFCSYCIVPHTRGLPHSKPMEECLKNASAFIAAGFSEIVVTGCNIACYAHGSDRLPQLLAALAALPGLGRLRVSSIEPGTVETEVAQLMAANDKLCRFLHLPAQSGDNDILARMGRRYTADQLAQTISDIVKLVPGLGLGTDIIAGFPGETREAFGNTRAWLAALPFNNLHIFPYSERPGTPAAAFDNQVPLAERKERARQLIDLGSDLRNKFADACVGHRSELLVERFDKNGLAHGWSGEYLPCVVSGVPRDRRRSLVNFRTDCSAGGTLHGTAC
ncbi:MAG: MiaB/RimO family radical SAM methylthiotransferase [Kiritimatiellae bacterium]|nr:MiaB/RimO family radical SAM methylthiotransferase [Kiritimatiellia bacterium]